MGKILVVDDHIGVCTAIRSRLEARRHAVHTAQTVDDGIAALQRAFAERQWYEVAIIDLVFQNYSGPRQPPPWEPGMRVLEVALQDHFLEPIVLTAHPTVPTAAEALEKGVFRYVTKSAADDRLPNDLMFFRRLAETVQLAIETRQVFKELDERLSGLRDLLNALRSTGSNPDLIEVASEYLHSAEKAYAIILKARGRHPG